LTCKSSESEIKYSILAGVGGERVRWAELEKFHMSRLATVVGDMLLSVGIIAYLGPFSVDYRKVIFSHIMMSNKF
jgi:Microtubule-binding stalk of dynein motor